MASLVEELISTLTDEEKLYQELIPIAQGKAEVVIKNNMDELQKITDEEQLFLDRIGALEQKRQTVVSNMAIVLNRKQEDLNLSAIIEILQKQPAEQEQLKKIHDKLKKTIGRLKDINFQNRVLIEDAMQMVEFNMNYIRSTRMSSGSSNYDRNASQMDYMSPGAGMFDAKQ